MTSRVIPSYEVVALDPGPGHVNGDALQPGDTIKTKSGRRYRVERVGLHLGIRQAIAMQILAAGTDHP